MYMRDFGRVEYFDFRKSHTYDKCSHKTLAAILIYFTTMGSKFHIWISLPD